MIYVGRDAAMRRVDELLGHPDIVVKVSIEKVF